MSVNEYDEVLDELGLMQEQRERENQKLLAAEDVEVVEVPASKMVKFKWYDRTLQRVVTEVFEIRIMTYRERMTRSRNAGLLAQLPWPLLPDNAQNYIMAVATSQVLWPAASDAWKRIVTEREDIALSAYNAVEAHRAEYFRGNLPAGVTEAETLGLDILPVVAP